MQLTCSCCIAAQDWNYRLIEFKGDEFKGSINHGVYNEHHNPGRMFCLLCWNGNMPSG